MEEFAQSLNNHTLVIKSSTDLEIIIREDYTWLWLGHHHSISVKGPKRNLRETHEIPICGAPRTSPFIHSFSKYLLSPYYVLGAVLGYSGEANKLALCPRVILSSGHPSHLPSRVRMTILHLHTHHLIHLYTNAFI